MSTEREEVPTMAKWWLRVAAAFFVVGFVVLPAREAASQQTPQPQATWTPRPECQRLDALRAALRKANRPPSPEEWQEIDRLEGGGDRCEHEAELHRPVQRYGPELGPLRAPDVFIRGPFVEPTPSP